MRPGRDEHIKQVQAWLDENVLVYKIPGIVSLSDFEIDWDTLDGSMQLSFDGVALPDRFRMSLNDNGYMTYWTPCYHSPLGAPASYWAY